MKKLKYAWVTLMREVRIYISVVFVCWAFNVLPKDKGCHRLIKWFSEMPIADLN